MLHPAVGIRSSGIHGQGLFTRWQLEVGTVVWRKDERSVCYTLDELLGLTPEQQSLCYQEGDHFVLVWDGSEHMNHSCDPNCGWLDGVSVVTMREIRPGEELTYDYATCDYHPALRERWACQCGTPACRGVIRADDSLSPDFQARYRGFLPPWTVDYIEKHLA